MAYNRTRAVSSKDSIIGGEYLLLMDEEVHGMYTKQYSRLFPRAALCLAILICSQSVPASSVLVSFDFDNEIGGYDDVPAFIADGLSTSGWQPEKGTISGFGGNPGRALATRNYVEGNTLVLELALAGGLRVDLDGIAFDHLASSSGPSNWGIRINDVEIVGGANASTFTHVNSTLAVANLADVIRVELWGTGATSNNGTYRLDNFELTGSVAPVPVVPAFVLLGSVLGLLPLARKR
jgi:hypothetical protein